MKPLAAGRTDGVLLAQQQQVDVHLKFLEFGKRRRKQGLVNRLAAAQVLQSLADGVGGQGGTPLLKCSAVLQNFSSDNLRLESRREHKEGTVVPFR